MDLCTGVLPPAGLQKQTQLLLLPFSCNKVVMLCSTFIDTRAVHVSHSRLFLSHVPKGCRCRIRTHTDCLYYLCCTSVLRFVSFWTSLEGMQMDSHVHHNVQ